MTRGTARVVCSGRLTYGIYGVLFVDTIFVDTFESKFEAAMRKSMTGLGMLQQERR